MKKTFIALTITASVFASSAVVYQFGHDRKDISSADYKKHDRKDISSADAQRDRKDVSSAD